MTMEELYSGYTAYNEKIQAKEEKIKRLKAQVAKLENKGGWIRLILHPLAKAISAELGGLQWEIYGPFGLGAETTVYFFTEEGHDICKDPSYFLQVEPFFEDGRMVLHYWTRKRSNDYAPGTIGELNGFNKIYEPLPDELPEIMKIVRANYCEKKEEEDGDTL